MSIKNIFIVGSGLMGSGIAQVSAQAGYNVTLYDIKQDVLEQAIGKIKWSIGKLHEKGKIAEPVDVIASRIAVSTSYDAAAQADLAVEAVFENAEIKKEVFRQLDRATPEKAILASNTSSIPVSSLAGETGRPEKVMGLHFFSPVPMMPVAEAIRGLWTTDETFDAGADFIRSLGKEVVRVQRDIPGFAVNRINYRANAEAMRLVEEGIVTVEDLDKGLKLGGGRKMGPFEIGDIVGLDVTYGGLLSMYEETRDPQFYPPAILRRKVQRGELGRKTGKGWYDYDADGNIIRKS